MSSRPRRAVLMVVDGLRADMVTPEHVPALARLAGGSRVFTRDTLAAMQFLTAKAWETVYDLLATWMIEGAEAAA